MHVDGTDILLPDQPQARFGIRQAHALEIGDGPALDGIDRLELRMLRVEQFLTGGEIISRGTERFGGDRCLLRGKRLARAEPGEREPHGDHLRPQPVGGIRRWRMG